jgi:biopolymer transport protein ExbB/TolQ
MQGGFYMWPLLLFAIIILSLSVKKIIDLFFKKDISHTNLETGINSILFWGGMSVLIGFLGHFHGLFLAMEAISRASDISPAIVAMGYGISLITVLFGLLNLLISALIWFVLRWRFKQLISTSE